MCQHGDKCAFSEWYYPKRHHHIKACYAFLGHLRSFSTGNATWISLAFFSSQMFILTAHFEWWVNATSLNIHPGGGCISFTFWKAFWVVRISDQHHKFWSSHILHCNYNEFWEHLKGNIKREYSSFLLMWL